MPGPRKKAVKKTPVKKTPVKKAVKKTPVKKAVKKTPVKKPVGRPSKYKKEYCSIPPRLAKQGKFIVHIAVAIGVHQDTLYEWAKVHPEFSEALRKAKAIAHAWHLNKMLRATTTTEFNVSKWFLAACFDHSEVQKIEQEVNQRIKSVVEFGERE